jgi:predicted metal-dependent enzyme (double-stranded beta helix superfamily)
MADLDRLIADCLESARGGDHLRAHAAMQTAFSDPDQVQAALGAPAKAGITPLYRSEELTVLNVVWAPHAVIRPHNHETWAVIGVYTGREDNIFWRRRKDDGRRIEAAGAKALSAGDVTPLGPDIIHSVVNPLDRLTGAIHVYGGDFFEIARSEWDPEALTEAPYDMAKTAALFAR